MLAQPFDADDTGLVRLIGRPVVFDTAGPVTILGTLTEICADGYWLADADIRNRAEGHVPTEVYVHEARREGIQPNRRRLFVFASKVISCAALDDVCCD